jgi:hypothetical protein
MEKKFVNGRVFLNYNYNWGWIVNIIGNGGDFN